MKKVAMIVFCAGISVAHAQQTYFGLALGQASKEETLKTMKNRGAAVDPNYGYKGYGGDLPIAKVISDPKMGKFQRFKEGWLYFAPDKAHTLYSIEASWTNSMNTFRLLRDALDSKYKVEKRCVKWGFDTECKWSDQKGKVRINLHLNEFGFNPTTTLTYTWQPVVPEVNRMKRLIELDIKKKNAQKAAGDI